MLRRDFPPRTPHPFPADVRDRRQRGAIVERLRLIERLRQLHHDVATIPAVLRVLLHHRMTGRA